VIAQGDLVRLPDAFCLDASQSFAQALASLSQELERVGGGVLCGGAIQISLVLLEKVCLKGRRDFVGRLQRLVDSPVPGSIVNHVASILVACLASQHLDLSRRESVRLSLEQTGEPGSRINFRFSWLPNSAVYLKPLRRYSSRGVLVALRRGADPPSDLRQGDGGGGLDVLAH